jgi:hypothetical protein
VTRLVVGIRPVGGQVINARPDGHTGMIDGAFQVEGALNHTAGYEGVFGPFWAESRLRYP